MQCPVCRSAIPFDELIRGFLVANKPSFSSYSTSSSSTHDGGQSGGDGGEDDAEAAEMKQIILRIQAQQQKLRDQVCVCVWGGELRGGGSSGSCKAEFE